MTNPLSLYELNLKIKDRIKSAFEQAVLVVAEVGEFRENGGHAFLELIEKDPDGKTIAKASANIWAYVYRMLKPYFETVTGRNLAAGIKILVSVSPEFNEIYGYSLNIKDIDPNYTLGDIEARRQKIILQLEQSGVLEMNKQTFLPQVPQRIAVISSETAAGYGDFIKHLSQNKEGFVFYTTLFPAIMQGEKAEDSIIDALELIFKKIHLFDAVVIIRGGGAKSDLECFDNFKLADNIAQFPIPVISGLGHDRDLSVTDLVSHTSLKTPTAVAQFFIDKASDFYTLLEDLRINVLQISEQIITDKQFELQNFYAKIKPASQNIISLNKSDLKINELRFKNSVRNLVNLQREKLERLKFKTESGCKKNVSEKNIGIKQFSVLFKISVKKYFDNRNQFLTSVEQKNNLLNPQNILKRGYSYTRLNNIPLQSVKQIKKGDKITTYLSDGSINSIVEK